MGHHNHCHALICKGAHGIQHLLHPFRIKGAGGFIEQHHVGFQGQRSGDGNPLLLTSAELGWIFASLFHDPHLGEKGHGLLLRLAACLVLHPDGCKGDVVEDGEVGKQVELLKHHAHPPADPLNLAWIGIAGEPESENLDLSIINGFQAIERTDQGAFA